MAMSIILMTLTIYMMSGGESSQVYLPLFEADVRSTMQLFGMVFVIYFLLWIGASVLMLFGISRMHRGMILPWLILMFLFVSFQAVYGIWLLYGYYIYLEVVVPTLLNWLWMAYNIYCFLCVYSQYQIIYLFQTPNIELLYP